MKESNPQDGKSVESCTPEKIDELLDGIDGKIRAIRFCVESMLHRMKIQEE